MESPHPDERPLKKRRFFDEASSPAQARITRPTSPPHSPPPEGASAVQAPHINNGDEDAEPLDAFDTAMLQAVVGELPSTIIQKLKDASGSDVQRGMWGLIMMPRNVSDTGSDQSLPRRLMESYAFPTSSTHLPGSSTSRANGDSKHP